MNLLQILKFQKVLSIRNFLHGFSRIVSSPEKKIYTITKNGKKVGTFIPAEFEEECMEIPYHLLEQPKKYKRLTDCYDELKFSGGDPNLSQNIDKILYGEHHKSE